MSLEHADGRSPQNQISLRSSVDLMKNVELYAWVRYVDRIASLDVPSYTTIDLHLRWKPLPGLELSVVGQNLLQDEHQEFYQAGWGTSAAAIPRGVYAKVVWRF
jgi:iron complex outermembrane receptor protein